MCRKPKYGIIESGPHELERKLRDHLILPAFIQPMNDHSDC